MMLSETARDLKFGLQAAESHDELHEMGLAINKARQDGKLRAYEVGILRGAYVQRQGDFREALRRATEIVNSKSEK